MKSIDTATFPEQGQLGAANSLFCQTQSPLEDKTLKLKTSNASDGADYFVVPGTSDTRVTLRFTWFEREALYDNEAGVYLVDDQGWVNGIAPTDSGYAQAAITSPTHKGV